jgi:hypothetical protein
MTWTLVVSDDDTFHREAIAMAGDSAIVCATGDAAACRLVGEIPVSRILVDSRSDVGRTFLSIARTLPASSLPLIISVGGAIPRFESAADLAVAFQTNGVAA